MDVLVLFDSVLFLSFFTMAITICWKVDLEIYTDLLHGIKVTVTFVVIYANTWFSNNNDTYCQSCSQHRRYIGGTVVR